MQEEFYFATRGAPEHLRRLARHMFPDCDQAAEWIYTKTDYADKLQALIDKEERRRGFY